MRQNSQNKRMVLVLIFVNRPIFSGHIDKNLKFKKSKIAVFENDPYYGRCTSSK